MRGDVDDEELCASGTEVLLSVVTRLNKYCISHHPASRFGRHGETAKSHARPPPGQLARYFVHATLPQVLGTESEARIHAARQAALAAEAVLEATQDEARQLRERHERAVAELSAEMIEKKRQGMEAVAARLQVQSLQ